MRSNIPNLWATPLKIFIILNLGCILLGIEALRVGKDLCLNLLTLESALNPYEDWKSFWYFVRVAFHLWCGLNRSKIPLVFSIDKVCLYNIIPYSSLLALNDYRQSLSRRVETKVPADVGDCWKDVLDAEEEVGFDEILNHLKEFLISRILFFICNHCENIRSHRNLLSREDFKGQT